MRFYKQLYWIQFLNICKTFSLQKQKNNTIPALTTIINPLYLKNKFPVTEQAQKCNDNSLVLFQFRFYHRYMHTCSISFYAYFSLIYQLPRSGNTSHWDIQCTSERRERKSNAMKLIRGDRETHELSQGPRTSTNIKSLSPHGPRPCPDT